MNKWLATSTVLPTILSTTTTTSTTTIPDQVSAGKLKSTSNPPTQARLQIAKMCLQKVRAKVFHEADLMITLMCIVQEPRTAAPPQTPSPPTRRPSSSPLFWLNLGLDARVAEAYRRRKLAIPVLIPTHFVPAICRVFQYCW